MILLIVFLPLLAAIVAGLGNRMIGNVPAKLVTTGALFVSCAEQRVPAGDVVVVGPPGKRRDVGVWRRVAVVEHRIDQQLVRQRRAPSVAGEDCQPGSQATAGKS